MEHIAHEVVPVEEEGEEEQRLFSDEKHEQVISAFESSFAEGGTPFFAGNMEDPVYLSIIQGLREFKPEDFVE